jgi:hypothetical protein
LDFVPCLIRSPRDSDLRALTLGHPGRCARCSLRRRAATLLPAGAGQVAAELSSVFEAICAARHPRSALNWLRNGAGAAVLADVAAGRLAATHDALDHHHRGRAADYLRHMLVAGGVLPPRDEELASTERWLTDLLASIDASVPRRARRRAAARGRRRPGQRRTARRADQRRPRRHPRGGRRRADAAAARRV